VKGGDGGAGYTLAKKEKEGGKDWLGQGGENYFPSAITIKKRRQEGRREKYAQTSNQDQVNVRGEILLHRRLQGGKDRSMKMTENLTWGRT